MKHLFFLFQTAIFLLFFSCSNDDNSSEIIDMRVNHYKATTRLFFGGLSTTLLVQKGDQIATDKFESISEGIRGFQYKSGFVYDLKVIKTKLSNPPQDASDTTYELLKVISKIATPIDTEFKVRLTEQWENIETFDNWVQIQDGGNYSIINSGINIDCKTLCNTLSEKINNKEQLTGVFIHGESNTYILKELLNE